MSVKLLMTWDIQQGKEQDYFEFVVREFIPGIQRLGLETTDAWFTMYGEHPQILVGAVSSSKDELEQVIESDDWRALTDELLKLVDNFESKIVAARRGFQM